MVLRLYTRQYLLCLKPERPWLTRFELKLFLGCEIHKYLKQEIDTKTTAYHGRCESGDDHRSRPSRSHASVS